MELKLNPFESRIEKRKSRIVGVRLNPKEYEKIKKKSEGNLSEFIRELIEQELEEVKQNDRFNT